MKEKETSQITEDLDCRINTNTKFGSVDLVKWFMDNIKFKKGEKVLDIGCGTGKILIEIAKKTKTNHSCIGLDLSSSSLETAKNNSLNKGLLINFINMNMDDLILQKDKYDTIISVYSIYYSNNIDSLLKQLKEMLNENGRLIIMCPYGDNNLEWFNFVSKFMTIPDNMMYANLIIMGRILPFALSNFKRIVCLPFENKVIMPNKEIFTDYWKSNIYYKDEYNPQFETFANNHFKNNSSFCNVKKAMLVIMEK